jgi:hypothetical protein
MMLPRLQLQEEGKLKTVPSPKRDGTVRYAISQTVAATLAESKGRFSE